MSGREELDVMPVTAAAGVTLEIPGFPALSFHSNVLPPIGTRIQIHKHLSDGGTTRILEVVRHEWLVDQPNEGDEFQFSVHIRTRDVAKAR